MNAAWAFPPNKKPSPVRARVFSRCHPTCHRSSATTEGISTRYGLSFRKAIPRALLTVPLRQSLLSRRISVCGSQVHSVRCAGAGFHLSRLSASRPATETPRLQPTSPAHSRFVFRCEETIAAPKKYVKRHIQQRPIGGARYRAVGKAADGEPPPLCWELSLLLATYPAAQRPLSC